MDQKGGYPRDNQPPEQNYNHQQPPPAYSDLPPHIGFQNPHQQQFQHAQFQQSQFPREPIIQQPTIVQSNYYIDIRFGLQLVLKRKSELSY